VLLTATRRASLIHQIKSLENWREVTRTGPWHFIANRMAPRWAEYELARRFADELGVKLKITPMRTYAEIYEAITTGRRTWQAAGLKVPMQAVPGVEVGPAYQHVHEHLIYRRGAVRPGFWLKSATRP